MPEATPWTVLAAALGIIALQARHILTLKKKNGHSNLIDRATFEKAEAAEQRRNDEMVIILRELKEQGTDHTEIIRGRLHDIANGVTILVVAEGSRRNR